MGYICLALQILFLLATIFLPTGNNSLIVFRKIYKLYLITEIFIQLLCIIINVIFLFVLNESMIFVLATHIILMGLINLCFSIKAKKFYLQKLIQIIIDEQLSKYSFKEIRNYILEKYELIYSIKDIENCVTKINSNL